MSSKDATHHNGPAISVIAIYIHPALPLVSAVDKLRLVQLICKHTKYSRMLRSGGVYAATIVMVLTAPQSLDLFAAGGPHIACASWLPRTGP